MAYLPVELGVSVGNLIVPQEWRVCTTELPGWNSVPVRVFEPLCVAGRNADVFTKHIWGENGELKERFTVAEVVYDTEDREQWLSEAMFAAAMLEVEARLGRTLHGGAAAVRWVARHRGVGRSRGGTSHWKSFSAAFEVQRGNMLRKGNFELGVQGWTAAVGARAVFKARLWVFWQRVAGGRGGEERDGEWFTVAGSRDGYRDLHTRPAWDRVGRRGDGRAMSVDSVCGEIEF
jgi:hypothetical protein